MIVREPAGRSSTAKDLRLEGLVKSYAKTPVVKGVSLTVPAGTMTSLIGPSGCGKTTTLRMIAGLEQANEGRICAGDRVLTEGARNVAPEARDMGMVFQSYALWPHLSVFENVAYGLKRRGHPRDAITRKVNDVLAIVGMDRYAERYPGQLSGGQQQRVALARSIATEPSILLFDEPLSNLDAVLREQMRFEIRTLQQRLGITGVYVTHSQDEALVLSDQIAVMQDGRIVQHGPPMEVYNEPRTEFVATFIGLANILAVQQPRWEAGRMHGRLVNGQPIVGAAGRCNSAPHSAEQAKVSIRPVEITLGRGPPPSDLTALRGVIGAVAFTGGLVDYFVHLDGEPAVTVRAQATPPIAGAPGEEVFLGVDPLRTVVLQD